MQHSHKVPERTQLKAAMRPSRPLMVTTDEDPSLLHLQFMALGVETEVPIKWRCPQQAWKS
eukprot:2350458-Amphidinium_carterae.1